MTRFSLHKLPIKEKVIFLRVDFNVPIKNKIITDNQKIKLTIPTIKYLLENDCKIIIATHLGRPNGKIKPEYSTKILAKELANFLSNTKIHFVKECIGKNLKDKIKKIKKREIIFLENLRFYKEETNNDIMFAHSLASLADYYINDAFSVSHRNHASLTTITKFLPSAGGFLLEKEIKELYKTFKQKKPIIWILGGAKLNKIDLIKSILKRTDFILIGGALAFSFLKALNIQTGMSKTDSKSIKIAQKILKFKNIKEKLILPLDFIVTNKLSPKNPSKIVDYNNINLNEIGLDIGPKTIKLFKKFLKNSKTIIWNGPLGLFEWKKYSTGTKEIGKYLGKINAIKICGGGETLAAVKKFNISKNFTHISTGGGATLTYLTGKNLPAITALEDNYNKYKKFIFH